jgi:hypothetical protein
MFIYMIINVNIFSENIANQVCRPYGFLLVD